jgi:hypothetical protein
MYTLAISLCLHIFVMFKLLCQVYEIRNGFVAFQACIKELPLVSVFRLGNQLRILSLKKNALLKQLEFISMWNVFHGNDIK